MIIQKAGSLTVTADEIPDEKEPDPMTLYDKYNKPDIEALYALYDIADEWSKAVQLNYPQIGSIVDIEPDWSIDDIYDIEKVKYKGDSKFLVRQYVWGEGGHADGVGALESLVSYDATNNTFIVEEAWLVLWQRNAYDMRTD